MSFYQSNSSKRCRQNGICSRQDKDFIFHWNFLSKFGWKTDKWSDTNSNKFLDKIWFKIFCSVSKEFKGDYLNMRQNEKWKKINNLTHDVNLVFADMIHKVNRADGKVWQVFLYFLFGFWGGYGWLIPT